MKLGANLTYLFAPAPMWERIDAAADAGFEGVEILQPYGEDADDLRHTLEAAGPGLVLINTPVPDWDAGGRGYAAVPGADAQFRDGLEQALAFAEDAACARIHVLAGKADGEAAESTYLENLAHAADRAPEVSFTIEPLNPGDQPGYFLADFELAARVLDQVNRPNLGLQFDVYHACKIADDPAAVWSSHGARVTHVQVAGRDRGAPDAEAIALLQTMRRDGYNGWAMAEYTTTGPTQDSLGWLGALD